VTERILVVEDDLLNRMLLCAVLQGSGFTVEAVTDGAHALAAAQRFRPDLVTMDINLPNISGVEIIRAMRADPALRHIPVLAVTAYVGKHEESLIRQAGATAFMAKPISIKPFLAAVNELLAARGIAGTNLQNAGQGQGRSSASGA